VSFKDEVTLNLDFGPSAVEHFYTLTDMWLSVFLRGRSSTVSMISGSTIVREHQPYSMDNIRHAYSCRENSTDPLYLSPHKGFISQRFISKAGIMIPNHTDSFYCFVINDELGWRLESFLMTFTGYTILASMDRSTRSRIIDSVDNISQLVDTITLATL
jgi:hypothetical protein